MTLHDLYEVLSDFGFISIVQCSADHKHEEIYCGFVNEFPYDLMRYYGSHEVSLVCYDDDIYLPREGTAVRGICIAINRGKEDD